MELLMYDSLNSGSCCSYYGLMNLLSNTLNKDVNSKHLSKGTPSGQLAFAVKRGENPELIEMFNNGLKLEEKC